MKKIYITLAKNSQVPMSKEELSALGVELYDLDIHTGANSSPMKSQFLPRLDFPELQDSPTLSECPLIESSIYIGKGWCGGLSFEGFFKRDFNEIFTRDFEYHALLGKEYAQIRFERGYGGTILLLLDYYCLTCYQKSSEWMAKNKVCTISFCGLKTNKYLIINNNRADLTKLYPSVYIWPKTGVYSWFCDHWRLKSEYPKSPTCHKHRGHRCSLVNLRHEPRDNRPTLRFTDHISTFEIFHLATEFRKDMGEDMSDNPRDSRAEECYFTCPVNPLWKQHLI